MLATARRSCASKLGKAKACQVRSSGRCGGFAERGFATVEVLPGANGIPARRHLSPGFAGSADHRRKGLL